MKQFWTSIKTIGRWIWISTLLIIAFLLMTQLKANEYYTNIIGGGIVFLLAIRRILLNFYLIRRGNPYFYFVVFTIAVSFPVLFDFFRQRDELTEFVIYYSIASYALIYLLGKSGKFGKRMKNQIAKSEEKSRKERKQQESKRAEQRKISEEKKISEKNENKQTTSQKEAPNKTKKNIVFCKNCGDSSSSVSGLIINTCKIGKKKGQKHVVFDSPISKDFTCKHCGRKFPTIRSMIVTNSCKASDKKHEPLEHV